jgi:DNA replication protein DnaC
MISFMNVLLDEQWEKIRRLVKTTYLIIDEFGHCNFDRKSTRLFFGCSGSQIWQRYANTMTFTSNVEPDKWIDFFSDEKSHIVNKIFPDEKPSWYHCFSLQNVIYYKKCDQFLPVNYDSS